MACSAINGVNIPNATNSFLVITNTQANQAGIYAVLIADNIGSILSPSAVLTMLINPVILQGPISQSVVAGQPVTLSVIVAGSPTPFGFAWFRQSSLMASNVVNGFVNSHTFNAAGTVSTQLYRVVVRNLAQTNLSANAACNIITLADADGDGIADIWEIANGLNTNSITDAALDSDDDTMSNRAEFLAGTDPNNSASYLRIDGITVNNGASLTFGAISNRTYTIQFLDSLNTGAWLKLMDIPARTNNRVETILDSAYTTNRLYRLATPLQP